MTKEEQLIITKYDLLYEQRMTRIETTLENIDQNMRENFAEIKSNIKSDFRWLLSLMIIFSGSLLGVMAKGFHWL